MLKKFTILGAMCFCMTLSAQNAGKRTEHSVSFKSQFLQIKDEFNYGLVHRGMNLVGEYTLVSHLDRNKFMYQAELGFGANYNQGVGMIWSLKPFDLHYGFSLNDSPELPITLGPYLAGYYKWQLYPELQSGHMFWISSYETGPRLELSVPMKKKLLHISLSTSLLSLNSRPEYTTEEYYYSLTFSDFVRNPHSNMTFGSWNLFNHTDLRIEWIQPEKGFSIAYEFEFMGYWDEPAFRYIAHSVNLNWKIGNKKLN
jgi:hypothetical protein